MSGHLKEAMPQLSVRLYKTISRTTVDGQVAVSARYQAKQPYIDLTGLLGDGSAVRTTKSVREPAGAFHITFADQPQKDGFSIESIYGLIEPMDMIEIRMWHGFGPAPVVLPIKMRGFVSRVQRPTAMSGDGKPMRSVTVVGHDYGKIWQTYQVLFLAAYAAGQSLLTSFALSEMFGLGAVNAMPAAEFVRTMVQKVINPHIKAFMPEHTPMPKELQTGDSIAVKHGMVNQSFQEMQGSIYDILKFHGDVGVWNELYTEDREDGVHVVYRPMPALLLSPPKGAKSRKIMDDAPDPTYVTVQDSFVVNYSPERADDNVANFYWVANSRFDMIDDVQRRMASIPSGDARVSLKDYPNASPKYYGVRPMYAETQQGGDGITNMTGGLPEPEHNARGDLQEAWIDKRRRQMLEINKDNVVYERGTVRIKGGPMRDTDAKGNMECMKAGDYARFQFGNVESEAYVTQIEDEFIPFQSYHTTLTFERGTGFAVRVGMEGGINSPWLAEQSRRLGS